MPFNCPVCDNDDYEEIDGYFFCSECQTQSQELIVQEAAANTEVTYRQEVKQAVSGAISNKKPKADLGRPWTIYEAYQIIIQAQVDGLIAEGASENLKDAVFTIWANYLSKLGVAFCKKEKLVPDIVIKTKFGRLRELHRGTLDNPLNRRKRPFTEQRSASSQADGTSHLKEEKFYEEDNLYDDANDNIIFLDDNIGKDEDGARRTCSIRHHKALKSPEWMNMRKTIAICYIGLMFTSRNILPCDVIRYVYESKVPFLSVTHLLPPDMILSAKDRALFETGRLDTSSFILEINRLLVYLKLDNMPSPDLDVIMPRFIKELCLPDEVSTFCHHLMKKIPFVWRLNTKNVYKRQDVLAMGYIVLALKIALGLNDSTELELSKYSQKVQDLLRPNIKLFVWNDWKAFMMRKSTDEFNAFKELTSDISKSKLQHLDELLDCYSKTESDKRRHSTWLSFNRHQHLIRCYQAEFRSSLRKPLEVAADRFANDTNRKQSCRSQEDLATRSQEFHLSTMSHIVDISLFQRQVGQISPENNIKFEKLLKRYSLPKTEVLQYDLRKDDDSLASHRHENYLWLLHLVCEIIDCSLIEVDKLVVHMLNYLLAESDGTAKPGLVCSGIGSYCLSEKSLKRRQLFLAK